MVAGFGLPTAPAGGGDRAAALQRAMFALNGQRPQEAQQIAEEILKSDPRHGQALQIFGCALLQQGRAADAIAPLETAARVRRDPEVETQLAIALQQAGRSEEALAQLKRASKRQPPYAAAFHGLGCLLFSMARYEEAIAALRRGVEVAPMMPEMSTQLGFAYLACKNYAEAKASFGQALAILPDAPEALFGIGKAHRETGENEAAAGYFRHCVMVRPDDDHTWLHLGHCLLDLGQREAGYDCFRMAARGDPSHYGNALASLAASAHGRFWLKPSAAALFLRKPKA
jgi:tetratricopeptide (TPR) repeat protein